MPEILSNFSEEIPASTPTQHREVDELLALAEGLQEKVDNWDRRTLPAAFFAFASLCLGVALSGWLLVRYPQPTTQNLFTWASSVVVVGIVWAGCAVVIRSYFETRRLRRREQYALEEVISLLREIEQSYVKDHHWSALERAKFRIRLSRFNVGRSRGNTKSAF